MTTRFKLIMVTCVFELNVRLNLHFISQCIASIMTVYRTLHWVSNHNRLHTGIVTYPFVFINQNTVRLLIFHLISITSVVERSKPLTFLTWSGVAWVRIPQEAYVFILNFCYIPVPNRSAELMQIKSSMTVHL